MILHFFKCGWRMLLRYRTQSIISIAGLSVGLLCFALCIYVIRYLHSFDDKFTNYDRTYQVRLVKIDDKEDYAFPPFVSLLPQLRLDAISSVEKYTVVDKGYIEADVIVERQGGIADPYTVTYLDIDPNFTDVFTIDFVRGDNQSAFHQLNSVLLSRSMAQKMFGSVDPIGEQIIVCNSEYDLRTAYTVSGVLEDLHQNNPFWSEKPIDLYFYREATEQALREVYALCSPQATLDDLNQKMDQQRITLEQSGEKKRPAFFPMERFNEKMSSDQKSLSYILLAIGSLILLVALLNFYLFTVGQFFNRMHEVGIRKSLGSNRFHQFGLLFTEQFISLSAVLLITLCLAEWIYPDGRFSLGNHSFPLSKADLSLQLVQYLLWLLVLSSAICSYVVWRCNRMNMQQTIKGSSRNKIRNIILTLQLFISILFAGGSTILQMQSWKIGREVYASLTPLEKEHILRIDLSHPYMAPHRQLMVDELKKCVAVKDRMVANIPLVSLNQSSVSTVPDFEWNEGTRVIVMMADNYASFVNLPIIRGREPMAPNEVLANKALLQALGTPDLGSTIYRKYGSGPSYTLVGEVGDVVKDVYSIEIPCTIIEGVRPEWVRYHYIKCYEGQIETVKELIRKISSQFLSPGHTLQMITLQDEIDARSSVDKSLGELIALLAVISLIITLLGVYSAITLDTERRQKEVAIRKVNGAGQMPLILLFGRFYLTILGLALLLAIPTIYIVSQRWLEAYVAKISVDVWFFLALTLFIILFVGITVIFRILRIIKQNPSEIIKTE